MGAGDAAGAVGQHQADARAQADGHQRASVLPRGGELAPNSAVGSSRTTRRSPSFAMASTASLPLVGAASSCSVSTVATSSTSTMTPANGGLRLDDDDLRALVGPAARHAQAHREVVDGDDRAAQGDDAADPVHA